MVEWKTEKTSSHIERNILTGMIVSDTVLRQLALVYKPAYFTTPFTKTIAGWCLEYLATYDTAPQEHIQDIYESHRRNGLDPTQAQLINHFLTSVSEDYEAQKSFNTEYIIDQATAYIRERSVILLKEQLEQHIETGDFMEAQVAINDYHHVENLTICGYEPLIDKNLIRRAFERSEETLLQLPGAFGALVGSLERDFLLGVAAPYKRGKTWGLGYFALQALYHHLNVAVFSLEMPIIRMTQRLLCSITGMPVTPPPNDLLLYPVWDCLLNQTGNCQNRDRINRQTIRTDESSAKMSYQEASNDYQPCTACKGRPQFIPSTWFTPRKVSPLTWKVAWEKGQAIYETMMGSRLKMISWPPYSAGLSQIKSVLKVWEYKDGFVPDVIIIDYADILAPEAGVKEYRHQLDRIWKGLKALAYTSHSLVITATQTNKSTLDKTNMKQGDLAEDTRKLGHVDAMLGINQTEREKSEKISRVVMIGQRYEDFSMLSQVILLQQFATGQFCLDSTFAKSRG
jgi:hypothetical protein